jgi:hypothetical protein
MRAGSSIWSTHLQSGAYIWRKSTSWNASRPIMARPTWPTSRITGVESWCADMDAEAGVGRTWPARDEADAGPAGQLAVRVRHVGRPALLAAHDKADVVARVVQRVEGGEIAFAGDAKNRVGAVDAQLVDQDLAAGPGHAKVPLLLPHPSTSSG